MVSPCFLTPLVAITSAIRIPSTQTDNGSATSSVAIGYVAAYGISGLYNNQGGVYLGYGSDLYASTNSDYNTFIGYRSGYEVSSGNDNILIGPEVNNGGNHLTTGTSNIGIGYNIVFPGGATAANQLNIGNFIFGTGLTATSSSTSIPGTLTGSIGLGTTTPGATLAVNGSGLFNGSLTAGTITATSTETVGNLIDTGITANSLPYINGSQQLAAVTLPSDATLTSGTLAINQLPIAQGGTNAISFATSGNGVYYNGTSLVTAPATSAVTYPYASSTAISATGSAYFATSGGLVGIGTTSPTDELTVDSGAIRSAGSYNQSTTNYGLYTGYLSGTPRILFANGNSAQNWQIDNSNGTFRWYLPGTTYLQLSSTELQNETGIYDLRDGTAGYELYLAENTTNQTVGIASANKPIVFYNTTNGGNPIGAGTELARLTTAGSFGLGTSSPYANLSVQNQYGSTSTSLFVIGSSTASNGSTASTLFTISNTGQVGIGTTSPASQLSNTATNQLDSAGNGINIANGLTWRANGAGYVASFANAASASLSNGVLINSADTSGNSRLLEVEAAGASKFLVSSNGNVGIGTTTPANALDVVGNMQITSIAGQPTLALTSYGTNQSAIINLNSSGTGSGIITSQGAIAIRPAGLGTLGSSQLMATSESALQAP